MSADRDAATLEAARRTMVDCQVRPSDVTDPALIDAMLWAPRELFTPKSKRSQAYVGEHIEIAPGRFELDPRVFAKLVDLSAARPQDLALVVGAGYGYAPAVLSKLCAAVVALEQDAALVSGMRTALDQAGVDNVILIEGGLDAGCAAHCPYNLIFVNGAIERDPPAALTDQLADGGRIVAVRMTGAIGRGVIYTKSGGALGARAEFDAAAPVLRGFEAEAGFVF